MLPLEVEPVVTHTKDSNTEGIDELLDVVVEESVGDGGVVLDSFGASRAGVWIVWTDEAGKFWPLEVCCTMSEEDCGQAQCVHHGDESTSLLESALPCTTQTGGIVQDTVGEFLPFLTDHSSQLFN